MRAWTLLSLWCLIFAAVFAGSATLESEAEKPIHASTTIYVEHALEPGQFTHRGTVTLGGVRGDLAKLTQNSLSSGEVAQLNSLANKGQYYQIRAKSSNSQTWIVAQTKACYLQSSVLADSLKFHLNKGQLYALSYTIPEAAERACTEGTKNTITNTRFQTTTSVDLGIEAPKPGIEAPPPTPAEKKAEQAQNQSFFSKYWMYIVPGVLIVVLNGITGGLAPPAEGEGQPAAAGARAPAAAARPAGRR